MTITLYLAVLGVVAASTTAADEKALRAWVDVPFPKRLAAPAVPYPKIPAQARVQGMLVARVTVGSDGRPTEVRIERGIPLFDAPAAETLRSWRYEPTIVDGVAREVLLYEPLLFTLTGKVAEYLAPIASLKPSTPWARDAKMWAVPILQVSVASEPAAATKVMQTLAKDPDQLVADAAKAALAAAPETK